MLHSLLSPNHSSQADTILSLKLGYCTQQGNLQESEMPSLVSNIIFIVKRETYEGIDFLNI